MSYVPSSPALNPDVVCSPLAEGGVLFDLSSKQYYALNASGIIVWQALEDGHSPASIAQAVTRHVSGAAADTLGVHEFCAQLVALELATASLLGDTAGSGESDAPLPAFPASWTRPQVTPHGRPLSKVILSPFDPTVPIPE